MLETEKPTLLHSLDSGARALAEAAYHLGEDDRRLYTKKVEDFIKRKLLETW